MSDLKQTLLYLEGVKKDVQRAISARKHGRWATFHKKIRRARMDLEIIEAQRIQHEAERARGWRQ